MHALLQFIKAEAWLAVCVCKTKNRVILLCGEELIPQKYRVSIKQRFIEIIHDPLPFSVAQGIFLLSSERLSRSALHLIEGERQVCTLVLWGGSLKEI